MSIAMKNDVSYWTDTVSEPNYPKLQDDIDADVAVVGGGITGLTCAYLLQQAGKKVVVIEKDLLGAGTTGHTTGKVTSQHNLIYSKLASHLGEDVAQSYGQANQQAIAHIETLINQAKIDCDWQADDNYVYSTNRSLVDQLKHEARLAKPFGLPATFETDTPLPFATAGAVRFTNQAKFHSLKYLHGLAQALTTMGGQIFQHSRVISIKDGGPKAMKVWGGGSVTAKDVIIATNVPTFPLIARGGYCLLEYPLMSYIVAGRWDKSLSGMYISPDKEHYSILPFQTNGQQLLLIGGQSHIPGTVFDQQQRYKRLEEYANKHFGLTAEYYWRARDYLGYDDKPLIGRLYPWSKHTYVATAFMKWGLSTSMVAGLILRDSILGQPNPWADTFNSLRFQPITAIPRTIKQFISH